MPKTTRRRMLRVSAAVLAGGAAGAGVTRRIATEATAAETDLDVTGDEAVIREGTLEAIWLDLDASWAYELPSGEDPETLTLEVLAGTNEDSMETLESTESDEIFLESNGSESFRVDLLDAGVLDEAAIPGDGGETEETTVHLAVEMRLYDERDMVVAADSQTDTATITLEMDDFDPNAKGDVSGSGDLEIESE